MPTRATLAELVAAATITDANAADVAHVAERTAAASAIRARSNRGLPSGLEPPS